MFHSPTLLLGLTVCLALKSYRIVSNDIAKTICQVLACAVTLSRFSVSIAGVAAMTLLSAGQIYSGWSTFKHSDAPVVLGAELSVVEAAAFTLGAFFNKIQGWPEHPPYYPALKYQMPALFFLAMATLGLFWKRGTEPRSIVFTAAMFGTAAFMMPQTSTHWALLNAVAAGVPLGFVLSPFVGMQVSS